MKMVVSRMAHRTYGTSMLAGLRVRRLLFMNCQNASISATLSTDSRTTSASLFALKAFLACRRASSSTKKDFRFSLALVDIAASASHDPFDRHTLFFDAAYLSILSTSRPTVDATVVVFREPQHVGSHHPLSQKDSVAVHLEETGPEDTHPPFACGSSDRDCAAARQMARPG